MTSQAKTDPLKAGQLVRKSFGLRQAVQALHFVPDSTVIFDRAYVDYGYLNDLNQQGVFFVTQMKSNCRFKSWNLVKRTGQA